MEENNQPSPFMFSVQSSTRDINVEEISVEEFLSVVQHMSQKDSEVEHMRSIQMKINNYLK